MQPVVDSHDRVVRWRQVVDLLSRLPEEYDEAIADAGFALVEREALGMPEEVRAATARNVASRPAKVRMVAMFARDRLAVAAPVLAAAHLSANEWATIARDCSPEVASFIQTVVRSAEPIREAPAGAEMPMPDAGPIGENVVSGEPPSISQMVARIEQLRSKRAEDDAGFVQGNADQPPGSDRRPATGSPAMGATRRSSASKPMAGNDALFRWESDPAGQIAWVDGVPRGALVGRSLSSLADSDSVRLAMHAREPFQAAPTHFDLPAVEGVWQLSGIPAFSPHDGRFLGYRGIAQRNDASPAPMSASRPVGESPVARPRNIESLRETIHEIKTPLNAIIGFAEIIDGQYLGPAHRNYRERAAGIVAQARTLLEAIKDMEVAARGQAAIDGPAEARVADFFGGLASDWQQKADRRGVRLMIREPATDLKCGIGAELAARLVRRFVDSVIDAATESERLLVEVSTDNQMCRFDVTRPSSTEGVSEAVLMKNSEGGGGGDDPILGLGFALRLIRGLARLVGGDVKVADDKLTLTVPQR